MRKWVLERATLQSWLVSGTFKILFTSLCSALTSAAPYELKGIRPAVLQVKFSCLAVTHGVLKIVPKG
mgnify:CR=1 FL=1